MRYVCIGCLTVFQIFFLEEYRYQRLLQQCYGPRATRIKVTDMTDDPLWGIQSETLSARLVAHYPHTYITHVTFMRITCSGLRHAGPIIRYLATDVNVVRM